MCHYTQFIYNDRVRPRLSYMLGKYSANKAASPPHTGHSDCTQGAGVACGPGQSTLSIAKALRSLPAWEIQPQVSTRPVVIRAVVTQHAELFLENSTVHFSTSVKRANV